jgi:hypothetical protein
MAPQPPGADAPRRRARPPVRPVALLIVLAIGAACGPAERSGTPDAPRGLDGGFTYASGQPELDQLQGLIRDTLEKNRRVFIGRTGQVTGFGAGALYPQIWLRDSATLMQVSRYLYPRLFLTSWIDEHLTYQRTDGSLFDWIAAATPARFRPVAPRVVEVYRRGSTVLSADRNSAASDQESSAVLAAAQAFAILGDRAWLTRSIAGRRLIDRLDAALEYVATQAIDRETGLVTAAFTADWGDVNPVYRDQRAIYRDDATPVVGGLYASVMFAAAAEALGGMYKSLGDGRGAGRWHVRARHMVESIDRALWQDEQGFYRVHRVIRTPGGWTAPSDDRFALGGNAVALLHGIADEGKVGRVLAAASARQSEYGLPTISGVLLPPYPAGTFRHPALRDPFEYQNGGQWDWWGGRLLLAAFERGYSETARRELARIAEQTVRMGGLYEWSTPDGHGRGSGTYAGTGGVIGAAILGGLYGVDLRRDRLDIHVRLGTESGHIRLGEPSTGALVRYDYTFESRTNRAVLNYQASLSGRGTVSIRLPPFARGATVRLDGTPAVAENLLVGRDRYVRIATDWAPHRVELAFTSP